MHLIFIYGLPGVGKYTVGKELAKKIGFKLFHNHMLLNPMIDIFGRGPQPIARIRESIFLTYIKEAITSNLPGLIVTFSFDSYLSKHFLSKVKKTLGSKNTITFVELTCDIPTLRKRVTDPSRKKMNKTQDFEWLMHEVNNKLFYIPHLRKNVITIDTTQLLPEEVVEILITQLTQRQ